MRFPFICGLLAVAFGLSGSPVTAVELLPDPNRPPGAVSFPIQGRQSGYFLIENQTGWTQRARLEQRWTARLGADGQFVAATSPLARHAIGMQINFDIGVLSEK